MKPSIFILFFASFGIGMNSFAQSDPLQERVAAGLLKPDQAGQSALSLRGLESYWYQTGDGRYFKAIQRQLDGLLNDPASTEPGKLNASEADLTGRGFLLVYKVLNQEKYYKAATAILNQYQPGLPGLAAEYGALYHQNDWLAVSTRTFFLQASGGKSTQASVGKGTQAPVGKDDQASAGNDTPASYGHDLNGALYGLALLDALDYYPPVLSGRDSLLFLLRSYATAAKATQESTTGLWSSSDVSISCLNVYILAKGVRSGYLPAEDLAAAKRGYAGIRKKFATAGGTFQSGATTESAGDGAFLLASSEMQMLPDLSLGHGRTVMLDYFFNNEHKKDITGTNVRFHYTWEDQANSGFSLLGNIFRGLGMHTDSLPVAPDGDNLKNASVYIIVDPDDEKETPAPNFMTPEKAEKIYNWVKNGGVLLLMSNDSGNAEFKHFNLLPERFGIHFNENSRNKVIGNQYEMGAFKMTGKEGIFMTTKKVYIKEISTLAVNTPAQAAFTDGGDVIFAVSKVGKGTVFAVGDPWFYNEYLDGRKLPAEYDNFNAAKDLAKWLISQIPATKK